jgi:hypothetical protein
MSLTLLPSGADDRADDPAGRRRLDQFRVALAGLLAWLRADPQRAQAALSGLLVCVVTGCALGLGAGLATDSLVTFLLELVTGP